MDESGKQILFFCQKHLTDFKDSMLTLKAVIAIQSSGRYPSSVVFGRIRKIIPFYSMLITLDSFKYFKVLRGCWFFNKFI